jgi:hypothetical protein
VNVKGSAVEACAVHLFEGFFRFILGLVNNVGCATVAVVGVVHEQVDIDYLAKILEDFVQVGRCDVLGQFLDNNLIAVSDRASINSFTATANCRCKRSF